MHSNIATIVAPAIAFAAGRLATSMMRRFAITIGFVDRPDRRRKLQETPIALGGGLAVWAAAWIGWVACLLGPAWVSADAAIEAVPAASLAVSSSLVLALGLVDDRIGMRGVKKLTGQTIAASVLVASGLRIDSFAGFGFVFELGNMASPATIFAIVLIINAFNLVDGMDGFCGCLGLVASLAVSLLSLGAGRPGDAVLGLALAGALAAFLLDNLPPARIYLGDAGSMTVGMMVAFLAIRACADGGGGAVSLPMMASLLILPLLDVAVAIGRRWLTGHSLFAPDRGHIHHRLRNRLGSTAVALGVGTAMATLAAAGAVMQRAWGMGDILVGLLIVTTVVPLVGTDTFGGSELRLLIFRLRPAVAGLLAGRGGAGAIRHECHLMGDRDWAGVWGALLREAESADLRHIELTIDIPAAGETYHGQWSLLGARGGEPGWSIVHSLCVGDAEAGTLRIAGGIASGGARSLDILEGLLGIVEDHLRSIASDPPAAFRPLPPARRPPIALAN
ncbi:MraY family glycosyltransferase (plasmid) [Tundrisphaera sp. TA3]|uniref:MraY family glycosyltransferase n=1 Tax=Tundrisphaera sp. TA3 TaxID=3435775 RepID=UPI003EBD539D